MLTPEFLQDIADSLVNGVYRELQEDILKDIIRRILKADFSITDTAKWQAYKLQRLLHEPKRPQRYRDRQGVR